MAKITKRMGFYEARRILAAISCDLNADYHTLDSNQVHRVVMEARQYGYRKPKNANGSLGRYFFSYVQRTARHQP